ncbi:MAG: 4Fe-4S dicluster domain-containing protein [Proteobacteria bacterium]|nr:4Fe-4S dicluster domain-containing protein [Pseudomonadota bacterium]
MTLSALSYNPQTAKSFIDEVIERSHQNLYACYQCRRCASGCTVGEETGITPDYLIRLVTLGDRDAAVDNALVWQCVSCYTCGTRCPNNIQSGRITETLKKMSREEDVIPLNPNIAYFHDAFVQGCTRWGRVNEMEFMGYYELKNIGKHMLSFQFRKAYEEIASQIKLGRSMFKQKRLHLKLHTSRGRKEVKQFYKIAVKKKASLKKERRSQIKNRQE